MVDLRTHIVARVAYERVIARKGAACKKEYGALAHKLPGMILQNGLAQATGFLLAKGKDEHKALLDDLAFLLKEIKATTSGSGETLHNEIIAANLDNTLLLTRRSLEASGWIKRYVQGALKIDATGEHHEEAGS
jgi:CRISPR-associated protein Cmr5